MDHDAGRTNSRAGELNIENWVGWATITRTTQACISSPGVSDLLVEKNDDSTAPSFYVSFRQIIRMLRSATYLLQAVLPGIFVFLAIPGTLWASSEAVSSNIGPRFERNLDGLQADSWMRMVEEDFFDDLLPAPVSVRSQPASDLPRTDRKEIVGAVLVSAELSGWSEFAAYDEIRNQRLDLYQLAESRVRTVVVSVPVIPYSGSSLTHGERNVSGNQSQSFRPGINAHASYPQTNSNQNNGIRFSSAAVNLAQRDYFSFRNGYCGRSWFSLSKTCLPHQPHSTAFFIQPRATVRATSHNCFSFLPTDSVLTRHPAVTSERNNVAMCSNSATFPGANV